MRSFLKVAALANALALLFFFVRYRAEEVHAHRSAATPHKPLTPLRETLHATLSEVLPDKTGLAAPDDQALIGAEAFPEYSIGEMLTQPDPDLAPNRELLMSGSKADAHMFRPSESEEESAGQGSLVDDVIPPRKEANPANVVENNSSNKASGYGNFGNNINQRKTAVKNK